MAPEVTLREGEMFHVESLEGSVIASFSTEKEAVAAVLQTRDAGRRTRWAQIRHCDDPKCVWCRATIQMLRRATYAMIAHDAVIAFPVCADCSTGDLEMDGIEVRRREIILDEHHRAENCEGCGVEIVRTPLIIRNGDALPQGNRWIWADAD
jgi:hypothetical protein